MHFLEFLLAAQSVTPSSSGPQLIGSSSQPSKTITGSEIATPPSGATDVDKGFSSLHGSVPTTLSTGMLFQACNGLYEVVKR